MSYGLKWTYDIKDPRGKWHEAHGDDGLAVRLSELQQQFGDDAEFYVLARFERIETGRPLRNQTCAGKPL